MAASSVADWLSYETVRRRHIDVGSDSFSYSSSCSPSSPPSSSVSLLLLLLKPSPHDSMSTSLMVANWRTTGVDAGVGGDDPRLMVNRLFGFLAKRLSVRFTRTSVSVDTVAVVVQDVAEPHPTASAAAKLTTKME